MEIPQTTHPHLASIGETLGRSLERHVLQNDAVQAAFAELAFELGIADEPSVPATMPEMLEPSA